MNGIDYLVDTNFLIHVLQINTLTKPFLEFKIGVSIITEIELLGVFSISKLQKSSVENLLYDCFILEMNQNIKKIVIELKQNYKIKLPDA